MGTGYDSWVTQDWWEYTPQNFSVEENNSEIQISLYPSIATDMLTVIASEAKQSHLEIFNSAGEKVFQSVTCNQQSVINISSLSKGIYFLKSSGEEKSVVKKFIKM